MLRLSLTALLTTAALAAAMADPAAAHITHAAPAETAEAGIAAAETAAAQAETAPAQTAPAEAAPAEEAPKAPAAQTKITFPQIAVCEDVRERQPVGESESFSSNVGRLWCFTHVVGADYPTEIYHRWYVGDRLVNEIPINVKGSSWRCWSRKTIQPGWSGPCRVEIVSEEGDVLATRAFSLVAGE